MAQNQLTVEQLLKLAVAEDASGNLVLRGISSTGALTDIDVSRRSTEQLLRGLFSDNGDGTYGFNVGGITGGSGTFVTLSGDVVSQVTGGASTIQPGVVTNAKLATVPALTLKGKNTVGTGAPLDLTVAEVKSMLAVTDSDVLTTVALTVNSVLYPIGTPVSTILAALNTAINQSYNVILSASYINIAAQEAATVAGQITQDITRKDVVMRDLTGDSITILGSTGTGTVTSASVVSANGFTGTVATATTTPAITLTTSVTGVLKGNGTAISAAVAGTDYVAPNAAITAGTGTKVTYDVKGLVTSSTAATASDITNVAAGNTSSVTVQAAINELQGDIDSLNTGSVTLSTAQTVSGVKTFSAQPLGIIGTSIGNTAAGNIAATTVQAAINELDTEKQTNITFQEEGVALGTAGTVDTINFVGSATTASRVGNVLTLTTTSGGTTNVQLAGTGTATGTKLDLDYIVLTGTPVPSYTIAAGIGTLTYSGGTAKTTRAQADIDTAADTAAGLFTLVINGLPASTMRRYPLAELVYTVSGGVPTTGAPHTYRNPQNAPAVTIVGGTAGSSISIKTGDVTAAGTTATLVVML